MENKPVYPRDRFSRDPAENPYDARALALRFGGSWAGLRLTMPFPMPEQGHRHLLHLTDARVGLAFRNWRNAK